MPLAYHPDERNPLVVALQEAELGPGVDLAIDARDEMLAFLAGSLDGDRDQALVQYLHSGHAIWSTLSQILAWGRGGLDRVEKLLDFASGYGRVTRFLVRDIPPERVWVADIYAEAVRFQAERFGVHGLTSTADPADFRCEERFDCILIASLFTHLPRETFVPWLERLTALLAPGGLLAFSVHDAGMIEHRREVDGHAFEEWSETALLAKSQYGTAWVSEDFVRGEIARLLPGSSAHRLRKGLVNYQDLWVVVDRPGVDFATLAPRWEPDFYVDACRFVPPDRVELRGWVADRAGGRPLRELQALLDGRPAAVCRDLDAREDVRRLWPGQRVEPQGWRLDVTLPPGASQATALLVLRSVAADGRVDVLAVTTVGAALLRSSRLDVLALREDLAEARRELARLGESEEKLGYEVAVREARIAAMQASSFWKLRDAWFLLKHRFGADGKD